MLDASLTRSTGGSPIPDDPTAAARREAFGDGELLLRFGAPDDRLRIECRDEKPGWRARTTGSQITAPHPGTAVEVEGVDGLFEVRAAEATATGVAYELARWEDRFAVRTVATYSRRSCAEAARARREERQRADATALAWLAAPFVGLLPADLQIALERRLAVPAARLTAISAASLLLPASGLLLLGVGATLAGGAATTDGLYAVAAGNLLLSAYLAIESTLRLVSGWIAGEPMGSLPVVAVVTVARTLRALASGQPAREAIGLATRADRQRPRPEAIPIDVVRRLTHPPGELHLEVISHLPKEHWTSRTLIRFGDEAWLLERRELVPAPDGERGEHHRFLLRPAEPDVLYAAVTTYQPDEVHGLAREALRRQRATWAETFALLWGLLEEPLQRDLEAVYGHDTETWTRRALATTAALGAVALISATRYLAGGAAVAGDGVMFAAGLAMLADAARRALGLRQGVILGSLLGLPLRPLARGLLRF